MANKSNLPKTWTQFIDILDQDQMVRDTLRDAARAKEVGPRAPAVLYLRAMKDAGDAYFEALPAPWSNQETKKHGDGTDVDADTVEKWSGDPKRFWDNYDYTVGGQKINGSVYLEMVDRTADGKLYFEFAKHCSDWNKDGDKTGLQSVLTFAGTEYDLEHMAPGRRNDLKAMADGRRYSARDNLRIVVQIWRNIRDINELFKGIAEVDFVYDPAVDENGEYQLAMVKKPIEVHGLVTIPEHPRFGQRSGEFFSCTSSQFANLAPRKVAAMENGKTLANLRSIKRKTAKAGAQPTTQEPGKVVVEAMVSSSNFQKIVYNIDNYVENFDTLPDAAASIWKRFKETGKDEQPQYAQSLVTVRDLMIAIVTREMETLAQHQNALDRDKAKKELADKLASEAATKEAERQPTQNERNSINDKIDSLKVAEAVFNKPAEDKPKPAGKKRNVR